MTSSVAQRRGASFTIAELIGSDAASEDGGNHDNGDYDISRLATIDSGCQDIMQVATQCRLTNGAFHAYQPTSIANSNFYQACLSWMRSRGMIN